MTKNTAVGLGDALTSTDTVASRLATHSVLPSSKRGLVAQVDVVQKDRVDSETGHLVHPGAASSDSHGALKIVVATQKMLLSKLQWATEELAGTSSVEYSTQLCQLIKACADALQSIEYYNSSTNPTAT